jgi:hypothetical protein
MAMLANHDFDENPGVAQLKTPGCLSPSRKSSRRTPPRIRSRTNSASYSETSPKLDFGREGRRAGRLVTAGVR